MHKNRKTTNMNFIITILIISFIVFGCKKDNKNLKKVEKVEIPKNIVTHVKIPTNDSIKIISKIEPSVRKILKLGMTPKTVQYDFPPKVIKKIPIEYPNYFKDKNFRGVVILEVEVFKNGKVGYINVKKSFSPGPGHLDEAAWKSVKLWEYSPALLNGEPIDCWLEIPIELMNNYEK